MPVGRTGANSEVGKRDGGAVFEYHCRGLISLSLTQLYRTRKVKKMFTFMTLHIRRSSKHELNAKFSEEHVIVQRHLVEVIFKSAIRPL